MRRFKDFRIKTKILAGLLVFTILSTIFIGFYISKTISKPINKLIKDTQLIGKGNIGHQLQVYSMDETGDLTLAFQRMLDDLNETMTSKAVLVEEVEYRKKTEENLLKTKALLEINKQELTVSNKTKDQLFSISPCQRGPDFAFM